ncbi:MAG TPA: TIGR03118 family protein [Terriglobales bacterium]|nr:TIGR03118 family protein [Terriglobales bacterium]
MRALTKLCVKPSLAAICLMAVLAVSSTAFAQKYSQTNLVSDMPGVAAVTDPNLINPWGMSFSSSSPFWISDAGTGLSTLYTGTGSIIPLVVTIPPPVGSAIPSIPTGQVFNGTSNFVVTANGVSAPALFLFVTINGTIAGWNPTVDGTHAVTAVDNSALGSIYTGLASANTAAGSFLYAANFKDGSVEMYDSNFQLVKTFTDTDLPLGYAPFGIRNIKGKLYVAYAKQSPGAGRGFVDVFSIHGQKLSTLISHGALNNPWGLTLAPAGFGKFSGSLLVGNFGNGRINAYDPASGAFLGSLRDSKNAPIVLDGLWALEFGNGHAAGKRNLLYFTSGPGQEAHGLFGSLQPIE